MPRPSKTPAPQGAGSALDHERKNGLGMDALVTLCSWNTNGIMVGSWVLWSPHALGTRLEAWLGHGCSGHRMLLDHERNYGLGMGALFTVSRGHRMLLEHDR